MMSEVATDSGVSDSMRDTLIGTYLVFSTVLMALAFGSNSVFSFIFAAVPALVTEYLQIGRLGEASYSELEDEPPNEDISSAGLLD